MPYKYKLSYATRSQDATPVDVGKIIVAQEEGEMFFREKLIGSVKFNCADYAFLWDAERYNVNCCQVITFTVIRSCSGETDETFWLGSFSLFDLEWNHDKQEVTVKKINPLDAYAEVYAKWQQEFNMALMGDKFAVYRFPRSNMFTDFIRSVIYRTFKISSRQTPTDAEFSRFFTDPMNPVTGKVNIFDRVAITHLSEIKRPDADTGATKGLITLKDLLSHLKQIFNVYWYIDPETGFLRLEHISFFPQMSYSPNVQTLDLTEEKYEDVMAGKNGYSHETDTIYGTEGLEFTLNRQVYDYWKDEPVEGYDVPAEFGGAYYLFRSECVPLDQKGERTEGIKSNSVFFTDIAGGEAYPDGVSQSGWALMEFERISNRRLIKSAPLPLSGVMAVNGNLSASMLFRDYHRYYTSFNYGTLNGTKDEEGGKAFPAKSVKNSKVFPAIELSKCCGELYDFSGTIKHPYGQKAVAKQIEYDLKTETIVLSLTAARDCDSTPVPDNDGEEPNNQCTPKGTLLRTSQRLEECPNVGRRRLKSSTDIYTYADGECGEYDVVGPTTILNNCI